MKDAGAFVRRLRAVHCIAVFALVAVGAAVRAQTGGVVDAAAAAPADADLVVVLDEAAPLRALPIGRAVRALLDKHDGDAAGGEGAEPADPFAQSREAWAALSARLGTEPATAFDELLGRRVMLVVRGGGEGPASWAVASWVPEKSGARLRKELQTALRGDESGVPVFGVEHGRFELAVINGEGSNVLVVWPGGAGEVGRPLAARIAGRGEGRKEATLGTVRALELVHVFAVRGGDGGVDDGDEAGPDAGEPRLLIMGRRGERDAAGSRIDAGDWMAAVASVDEAGAKLRFSVLDCDSSMRGDLAKIEPWSLGKFAELARGSLGAMIVHGSALETAPTASMVGAFGRLVGDLVGQLGVGHGRVAAAVYPGTKGFVDVAIAVEVAGGMAGGDGLAGKLDAWMSGRLAKLGVVKFDGNCAMSDGGVRCAELPPFPGGLPWDGAEVAWVTSPGRVGPEAAQSAPMWCSAGVGSADTVAQVAAVLTAEHIDMETHPWVEVVEVRPRALTEALKGTGVGKFAAVYSMVERMDWRTYARADLGLIVGRGEVELVGP